MELSLIAFGGLVSQTEALHLYVGLSARYPMKMAIETHTHTHNFSGLPFVVHAILVVWTAEVQAQKIVRLGVGMLGYR